VQHIHVHEAAPRWRNLATGPAVTLLATVTANRLITWYQGEVTPEAYCLSVGLAVAGAQPPSQANGPAFLRCGGASPPAATRSTKTHVAHRRIKIERVYRPYLTVRRLQPARCPALEFAVIVVANSASGLQFFASLAERVMVSTAVVSGRKLLNLDCGRPRKLLGKRAVTKPMRLQCGSSPHFQMQQRRACHAESEHPQNLARLSCSIPHSAAFEYLAHSK
jgi:hypothetical protein